LENLRNSGNAKASQLAKAEQQLETAKNKQADAAVRVSREEKNLDAARSGGETKSTALARAEDQLANARTSQQTASAKIRTAEIQLDEARANAKSKSDAVSAAEKNLMDTRDRYGANTKQTAAAERQLETAKKQAATANNQVATAEGRVKRTRAESQSAADTLKAKELSLKAVQEDLARSSQRAAEKTKTMGDSFKSAAGKAADFAGKYKVHATAALGGIGLIAKESISYAAEAEQSYGAVESIFGDHAQGIISASKGAAEAVGLSGREYRELTASTGAMLKNMGMPMDEVASKSQNLVGVASDLAATFGGSTKDAIEAVNALMRGEADPIERYGVSIKQSDINARMAAKGLDKLTGSAAKQAQAQTLLEMLTEQTSSAQGQFGRETDTAAHKQQVATAKFNDAKEAIGTGLLPMFAELASKGAVLAGVIGRHPKVFIALGTAVGIAAGAIVAMATVAPIFTAISGAAAAAEMSMWGYVAAQAAAIAPILAVVAAVAAVGVALWAFFTKTEIGRNMWDAFTHALAAGWDWVVEKFKAGLDWVQSTFGPVFSQIGDTISGAWDATVEKVTGAVDRVKEIFSGALDFLKTGDTTDYAAALGISEDSPIFTALTFFRDRIVDVKNGAVAAWDFMKAKWSDFTTGFGQFYQTWIVPVIDFIGTAFGALKDVVVAAWGLMKAKWEEFTIGFGQFYQTWIAPGVNLLVTIFGVLRDAAVAGWHLMQQKWQEFTQLFVEFYQAWIVPIIDAMKIGFQILGSVVSAAFNGIWTAIQFVGSVISAVWSGIIQPILSLFMSVAQAVGTFVASVFTAVIGGAFRVMGSVISSIWNGVIKPTWDFFRNAAGLLADVLTGSFSNIRNRFSSMGQAISNIVHGVINAAMNFFKSIFENAKQVAASFGQAIGRMVGTVRNKIGEM
ncbi:hypothetical protein, partial [uncultured Corynebacterium sp.]|uniref:hypothetical protein n=1 Tax=uncultured Corynebacterium sp. TaxID=159447 RepID=UPI0025978979